MLHTSHTAPLRHPESEMSLLYSVVQQGFSMAMCAQIPVFAQKKTILKTWTEINKTIFILSIAQTFVSGVTGSGGLALQPERKGVFWDNIYRWYVSMFIYFKQLCYYCNMKPYLWYMTAWHDGKITFSLQEERVSILCLCCLAGGRHEIENICKMFSGHKAENPCKILSWWFHISYLSHMVKKLIQW